MLALGRLVGVGVGAHGNWFDLVALCADLGSQSLHGVHLHIDVALELDAGRMPEKSMARPRIAVGTAMLAAAIRINRPLEADIGAVIGGDDGLGTLGMFHCLEDRERFNIVPAVIKAFALLPLEPAGQIALCATPADPLGFQQLAPRQIGIAAAAELFKGFKRGRLVKGHETSPAGRAGHESCTTATTSM